MPTDGVTSEFEAAQRRYRQKLPERLRRIATALVGDASAAARLDAREDAHKLSGTVRPYGLAELEEPLRQAESFLTEPATDATAPGLAEIIRDAAAALDREPSGEAS